MPARQGQRGLWRERREPSSVASSNASLRTTWRTTPDRVGCSSRHGGGGARADARSAAHCVGRRGLRVGSSGRGGGSDRQGREVRSTAMRKSGIRTSLTSSADAASTPPRPVGKIESSLLLPSHLERATSVLVLFPVNTGQSGTGPAGSAGTSFADGRWFVGLREQIVGGMDLECVRGEGRSKTSGTWRPGLRHQVYA